MTLSTPVNPANTLYAGDCPAGIYLGTIDSTGRVFEVENSDIRIDLDTASTIPFSGVRLKLFMHASGWTLKSLDGHVVYMWTLNGGLRKADGTRTPPVLSAPKQAKPEGI